MAMRNREDDGMITKVVSINRVSKTVKGGRIMKFAALVVVGDGKGTIGYGIGKSGEVPEAIRKGEAAAKKNMHKVAVKGTTTPPRDRRKVRRRRSPAEAGCRRYRHDRRRPRACRHRGCRHQGHSCEVYAFQQPHQCCVCYLRRSVRPGQRRVCC